jgi:uncharacterized protein (DUF934 family)
MSALIEFDRISGALRGADLAGRDLPLLGPDEWNGQADAGLLLQGETEPEPRFANAPLIAISFPAFYDGRGLSLAVLLRTRFGFRGELRAVGDIRPDLLHYLKRCGFDSFLLADGVSVDFDDPRLAPHAHYYQASVVDPQPVFRRIQRSA